MAYTINHNTVRYDTKEQLIDWLIKDLDTQEKIADAHNKIPADAERILNIGSIENPLQWVIIKFDFVFKDILQAIAPNNEDGYCPYSIHCKKVHFASSADFSGVRFKAVAYFSEVTFAEVAHFTLVTFAQEAYFRGATFAQEANFFFATFVQKADFSEATFENEADFSEATFENEAHFYKVTFAQETNFSEATFENEAHFYKVTFAQKAHFAFVTFAQKANFSRTTFENEADFIEVIFAQKADFAFVTFAQKADFTLVTFAQKANFWKSTFKAVADFTNSTFKAVADFSEVTFAQEANFSNSTFTQKANFSNSTFAQEANFSAVTFEQRATFYMTCIKSTLIFNNITLHNESYLSFANIQYTSEEKKFVTPHEDSQIQIINTIISGRIDFNQVWVKQIDFDGSTCIGNGTLNRIKFKSDCANWETARFLKHEELARDNIIGALEYKALEKDLYHKYMREKNKGESAKRAFTNWAERASLCLSKISNNHGQNWFQAVIFTLIIGAVFYALFYAPTPCISTNRAYPWKDFFSSLALYYIPVDYSGVQKYIARGDLPEWLKACGAAVYIIGKIGISYGYVEVVQAFRKLR